jgi:hypothetical protein
MHENPILYTEIQFAYFSVANHMSSVPMKECPRAFNMHNWLSRTRFD